MNNSLVISNLSRLDWINELKIRSIKFYDILLKKIEKNYKKPFL